MHGVHSEVIYGDTDSVMVKLHNAEVTRRAARAWRIDLLANYISGTAFGPCPIVLEAEDLSSPFRCGPIRKRTSNGARSRPDNPTTWADWHGLTKKGRDESL